MQTIKYQNQDLVDKETQKQINDLLDNPCLKDSHIAIMNDAHYLQGIVPVGFSATLNNGIIDPNIISKDMSCGITIMNLDSWKPHQPKNKFDYDDFKKIDNIIRGFMIDQERRFGINSINRYDFYKFGGDKNGSNVSNFINDAWKIIDKLIEKGIIDETKAQFCMNSFGTIGGGNHFIELLKDDENKYYLAVHSGSRSLGVAIHNYFINKWQNQIRQDYAQKIKDILENVPNQDKQKVAIEYKTNHKINTKYCSVPIEEYYEINKLVYEWAYLSRKTMLSIIIGELDLFRKLSIGDNNEIGSKYFDFRAYETEVKELLNISHNWLEKCGDLYIARKGSVPNWNNEYVAIALTQCEGILVAKGNENRDLNFTVSHGLGRKFSRTIARKTFTLEQHKQAMEDFNVYSSTINKGTLDEIMFAYKDSSQVLNDIKDYLININILMPVYNFKCEN